MLNTQQTISPVDGSIYLERDYANPEQITLALDLAHTAQKAWRKVSLVQFGCASVSVK